MLLKLFIAFLKIGAFSFGGGYAMVPFIQKEIVENNTWLSNQQLADILAISQMTPGPIAINSATFIGYKAGGVAGALVATIGVVLPSFLIILTIAILLKKYVSSSIVAAILSGIKGVLVALILSAAFILIPGTFLNITSIIIFVIVMAGLNFVKIDPVLLLLGSGIIGIILF